jgi:hypothetical protein
LWHRYCLKDCRFQINIWQKNQGEEEKKMKKWIMVCLIIVGMALPGLCLAQSGSGTVADTKGFVPPKPNLEYLGRWSVDLVAPIWELGQTSDLGRRRIIPITGGTFNGSNFKGKILNNGADWQIVTKDGLAIIDTRYLLQTDDGEYVYLQTKGYRFGPPEVMAKVAKGEVVDANLYNFRITMQFETSSKKYDYLNRYIGIAFAMRLGNAVVYDAYLVK